MQKISIQHRSYQWPLQVVVQRRVQMVSLNINQNSHIKQNSTVAPTTASISLEIIICLILNLIMNFNNLEALMQEALWQW